MVQVYYHLHLITAYPDDDKFVDCAFKANAKYIVTQDHHYDVLRNFPFPKIEVVDIDEFLIILGFLFYRESAIFGVFNAILNDEFTLFVWLKL